MAAAYVRLGTEAIGLADLRVITEEFFTPNQSTENIRVRFNAEKVVFTNESNRTSVFGVADPVDLQVSVS